MRIHDAPRWHCKLSNLFLRLRMHAKRMRGRETGTEREKEDEE